MRRRGWAVTLALALLLGCGPGGSGQSRDGASDAGSDECVRITCADLHADCGQIKDGCGGTSDCGQRCPYGKTCGGGGMPNVCGAEPDLRGR